MSKLVSESVPRTIVRMAIPMLAGTFAMTMYQLTNAWFVSRLGTEALAAISFTFPVVMLLMLLVRGIGNGVVTLVAHAIGSRDQKRAAVITTHALVFAVLFAIVMTAAGLVTIEPVFSRLGASGTVLDLTARYMRLWYAGAVVMALQMIGMDIIMSTGNTKAASLLMVASTILNVFFDMGLIFGMFGMPRMGIAGAALATILAQGLTLAVAFYMIKRFRLIDTSDVGAGALMRSWLQILRFGVPASLGMILTPISSAVVTKLVASYGDEAVAAIGVASRIEMFAFMVPMSVGMSLIPFIAQNYGAGRMDRIRQARKGTMIFAVLYGVVIGVLFIVFAERMAGLFSTDRAVIDVLSRCIVITCMGFGMMEVNRYASFTMTGTHEPMRGSALNIIRAAFLLIPLSLVGGYWFGLTGIFWGRLATDILSGLVGIVWSGSVLTAKERRAAEAANGSQMGGCMDAPAAVRADSPGGQA